MQVLYQLDVRGPDDAQLIHDGLPQGPDADRIQEAAFELAQAAWADHAAADALFTEFAPQWPSHRQPPVDRAILRLAHYEIVSERTPTKAAINEAVELAKKFGGKQSFAFINGVLDKMAKSLGKTGEQESRSAENVG